MSDPFLRESSYRVLSDQVGEFVEWQTTRLQSLRSQHIAYMSNSVAAQV